MQTERDEKRLSIHKKWPRNRERRRVTPIHVLICVRPSDLELYIVECRQRKNDPNYPSNGKLISFRNEGECPFESINWVDDKRGKSFSFKVKKKTIIEINFYRAQYQYLFGRKKREQKEFHK